MVRFLSITLRLGDAGDYGRYMQPINLFLQTAGGALAVAQTFKVTIRKSRD